MDSISDIFDNLNIDRSNRLAIEMTKSQINTIHDLLTGCKLPLKNLVIILKTYSNLTCHIRDDNVLEVINDLKWFNDQRISIKWILDRSKDILNYQIRVSNPHR